MDEWNLLKCEVDLADSKCQRIEDYWYQFFCMKSIRGELKYPLVSTVVKTV